MLNCQVLWHIIYIIILIFYSKVFPGQAAVFGGEPGRHTHTHTHTRIHTLREINGLYSNKSGLTSSEILLSEGSMLNHLQLRTHVHAHRVTYKPQGKNICARIAAINACAIRKIMKLRCAFLNRINCCARKFLVCST